MKSTPRAFLALLLLLLSAQLCRAEDLPATPPSEHQKLYYVQHRLLPKWTHQSGGNFYADLAQGNVERMKTILTKILGEKAAGIKCEFLPEPGLVLLSFPEPQDITDCYFAGIVKTADRFHYFTLEKTEDLTGDDDVACFCEWSPEGDHKNYGGRKDISRAGFLQAIKDLLAQPQTRPAATLQLAAPAKSQP